VCTLPMEVLICIVSLLTAREKAKMRNVTQKLRSVVNETPSLWREFERPYYHTSEEGYVNSAIGQYVKRVSFPHYMTPAKLVEMLQHSCNKTWTTNNQFKSSTTKKSFQMYDVLTRT